MSDPTTQDPAATSPGDTPPAPAPDAPALAPATDAPAAPAAAAAAADTPAATDAPEPPYDRTQSVEDRLYDLEEALFEKILPRLVAVIGEL